MSLLRSLLLFSILCAILFFASTNAAQFDIQNNCNYTVWAAVVPGDSRQLSRGDSWPVDVSAGTTGALIWARKGCNFDGAGHGQCQTCDCGGVHKCQGYCQPPNTLAEYALTQCDSLDVFDISLVGFKARVLFSPTSRECNKGLRCTANNNGQCFNQLKAPGGCNNPCTGFNTDQYCCNSGNCGPTDFSRFCKSCCADAYSYPEDGPTSTFKCPLGTNYNVVFCP